MGIFPLVIVIAIVFVTTHTAVHVINENQRGALFRLGRFERILPPGLVVSVPFLDQVIKISLVDKIPGWQGMDRDTLDQKVREIALNELK